MSPHAIAPELDKHASDSKEGTAFIVPIARVLLSLIFVFAGLSHFSSGPIAYAASQGVPLAGVAVPFSGVMALAGGLSVALGYKAKWGGWILLAFLIPVTFMMHKFWAVTDPMAQQIQMAMFMKNLGLMGGALLVAHLGAGPYSLDARKS